MSREYDLYLQRHKANVKRGYDWLRTNMPWLFEGQPDSAWQTEFEHDASKSNPDEYEAYDAYFYGGNRSYAVVQAFQYAWLLHMNGRRIYTSRADLAAALNVGELYTAEQFEGRARMDGEGKQHKLLGIFVNLADYTVGSTKGGEITRFDQFDIDFNQQKYLIETRLSGALTRVYSAIALEEPVATGTGGGSGLGG